MNRQNESHMSANPSKTWLIRAEAVTKTVTTPEGPLCILRPVSLAIKPGESLSVMGPSGSGKTTLLSLLAGLDVPTEGRVFYQETNLSDLNEEGRTRLRAGRVGFVFQSFLLIESLTALENVMLPLELAQIQHPRERAIESLRDVGLEHRLHQRPRQLSGGEQQRVALARAFVIRPEILFADEPTGNLDRRSAERIADLLFALNQRDQTALILVTHDSELAQRTVRCLRLEESASDRDGAA